MTEPVGALQHSRVADKKNIQGSIELERNQDPAIAPLADRFGKAQIEQKPIIDDVILHMTRGETRNSTLGHVDMDGWRSGARACYKKADYCIEASHDTCTEGDEDGGHKPGNGRPTPAPDNDPRSEERRVGKECRSR